MVDYRHISESRVVWFLKKENRIACCIWAVQEAMLYRLASVDIILEYSKVSVVGSSCR